MAFGSIKLRDGRGCALDKLDKAILRALQANGRETYDVVGEQVGLSPSAVLRRVKRLEEAGIIDRYVALVRPEAVGLGLTAYINVRLEKHTEHHKRNPMDLFRPDPLAGAGHRERIAAHLLALDEHDRYLRFGYRQPTNRSAAMSPAWISSATRSSASSTASSN
jgi:DNA-binding Lrp family transcriptional regulator